MALTPARIERHAGGGRCVSLASFEQNAGKTNTSVEQIDGTYGHLLPDAADYERGLLDAFDERQEEQAERLGPSVGPPRSAWGEDCQTGRPRVSGAFLFIGAPGFEPGTSCPPDKRANQAAPRPVRVCRLPERQNRPSGLRLGYGRRGASLSATLRRRQRGDPRP